MKCDTCIHLVARYCNNYDVRIYYVCRCNEKSFGGGGFWKEPWCEKLKKDYYKEKK